jgi:ABC-type antimicrobial peptide transport system permease subunit
MIRKRLRPPRLAEWLLGRMVKTGEEFSAKGDFEEEFAAIAEESGRFFAAAWYWLQVLIYLPSFFKTSIYWSLIMFKNYLKVALRNLRKHKGYSIINIAGLATGMAVCILILLWVQDETSFDRFNANADQIYRVCFSDLWSGNRVKFSSTPTGIGPALKQDFPEVMDSARLYRMRHLLIGYEGKRMVEEYVYLADPSLFEMFSFPFIKGDPRKALDDPQSVVLSERAAVKYFGSSDPVGKILTIGSSTDFMVTGVFENIPKNSHLRFEICLPFQYLKELGIDLQMWTNWAYNTYVLLHPESPVIPDRRLTEYYQSHVSSFENVQMHLLPLKDIHLRSQAIGGIGADGDIKYVYVFSLIAFFVLLIACINFMNLSTAKSGMRAREVGMRKVVGALRRDIVRQFFGESLLQAFVSLFFALVLVKALLPLFNQIAAKELSLDLTSNLFLYLGLLGIAVFTGILSGSYPALFLSSFHPVTVLKGLGSTQAKARTVFRKVLVITQFSLTIVMIIGTIIIYNQIRFMREKKLGFDQEHLVVVSLTRSLMNNCDAFKQEILRNPGVLEASLASSRQFHGTPSDLWRGDTADKNVRVFLNIVDENYLETFGMEMVEGRFFSREFSDDKNNFVLNETAVKAMGLENPIGKPLTISRRKGIVIGIIKDFHFETLNREIGPLCLFNSGENSRYLFARVSPQNLDATIGFIRSAWKKFDSHYPLFYQFFDEDFDSLYRSERRIGTIVRYFAVLAVFISCLGLFGLAAFMAERRTKEIGIRRVLGASSVAIVALLSREFAKCVLVSNAIAWPVAYVIMHKWLANFAYRTGIGIGIYLVAAGLALGIALLTVSFQSVKAAAANPADSLRYE